MTRQDILQQLLNSWKNEVRHPDLAGLRRRLSSLTDRLEAVGAETDDVVRIVNAGLLKAGKSLLFSALSGRRETFAVGAARCTLKSATCSFGDALLCDTPGIDAYDEDQREAEKALQNAHLIVFVHSMSQGELQAPEITFLTTLRAMVQSNGPGDLRIVPVLTRTDEVGERKEQERLVRRLQEQWRETLNEPSPEWFRTSATRFMKSLATGDQRWAELSGVPRLRAYLEHRVPELRSLIPCLRRRRMQEIIDAMAIPVKAAEQERVRIALAKKRAAAEKAQRQRRHLKELMESIEARRSSI
ncbi:MAG TPA: 50S ribosome-binding GTPase [Candidatus Ozemobacteraceae bacterium]|nr:50S ribosome-binding GTPase [Candidatus Ozemobacteraceae bacterium]